MKNLSKYTEFWAKTTPDALAVTDEKYSFSFRELDILVHQSANLFRELGIKSGDLVAVKLNSVFNFIFTIVFNSMGVKVIIRDNDNRLPEILEPDFFLTLSKIDWFPDERTIIFDEALIKKLKKSEQNSLLNGFRSDLIPGLIWSTSGTTGQEKFVELNAHEFYCRILEPTISSLFPDDHCISLLPFGAFWSTKIAFQALVFGKPYITFMSANERILEVMSRHSVHTVLGSPGQIARLLDDVENLIKENRKVPKLSTFIIGGETPSKRLIERIRSLFDCRIFNNYGSTEVGGIAHCEVRIGDEPLIIRPFVDLEIVDSEDRVLPYGVEGQIRVRGVSQPNMYLGDTEESARRFKFGFHYSGDLGLLDRNGNLILAGRSESVLRIAGSKIHPATLESQLGLLPGVQACAAFAWLNPEKGVEELSLALTVSEPFSIDRLTDWLVARLDSLGVVNLFWVDEVPFSANGKLLRGELTTRLNANKPGLRVVTSQNFSA